MPQFESDFSLRKMKIAGAVLLGQMFASSLLPAMALTLAFMPVTTEFGATVAGLTLAALIYLVLGPYRFAKHIGAVAQARAQPERAKSIDFAERSAT
jgi:hypothetical protein